MDLTFLTEMYVPVIVVACLVIGYCIKHISWIDSGCNEYIPTILALVGAILSIIIAKTTNTSITVETVVYGAFSGLASTGMHQAFKAFIERD